MARRRLLTKTEYAKHCGVDKAQPGRWVKRGMPTAGPNGDLIDPEVADTWRAANIDASKPKAKAHQIDRLSSPPPDVKAAAVAPRPAKPARAPDPAALDEADSQPDGLSLEGAVIQFADGTKIDIKSLPNLNALNQIDKWYSGELKRREILVHDRDHLPKADLYAATDALISMFRARVMGLGRRCAPMLEGRSLAERAEVIQDECRKVLEDLAKKLADSATGDVSVNEEAETEDEGSTEKESD
ncbi:hypothetical protein J2847_005872 [Azospirillum agricola]|uniref:hypothetical protein n=1 Tax=Azospirillum agricola TaxID=1720247 RepID=UPI001AE12F2F|nr:hypothetical protein [Azospirillum agricola]MBP2232543.1 hypothetical protein [Azospirillum agricola]